MKTENMPRKTTDFDDDTPRKLIKTQDLRICTRPGGVSQLETVLKDYKDLRELVSRFAH